MTRHGFGGSVVSAVRRFSATFAILIFFTWSTTFGDVTWVCLHPDGEQHVLDLSAANAVPEAGCCGELALSIAATSAHHHCDGCEDVSVEPGDSIRSSGADIAGAAPGLISDTLLPGTEDPFAWEREIDSRSRLIGAPLRSHHAHSVEVARMVVLHI